MAHDPNKLPMWAQEIISSLQHKNETLTRELEQTQRAAAITCNPKRSWFTIMGPHLAGADPYHLWRLYDDNPHKVCVLNHGDILLVGRKPN